MTQWMSFRVATTFVERNLESKGLLQASWLASVVSSRSIMIQTQGPSLLPGNTTMRWSPAPDWRSIPKACSKNGESLLGIAANTAAPCRNVQ